MSTPIFSEFEAVTSEQWTAQLEKALKGAPLDSLTTNTLEDIPVKAFYRREDTLDLPSFPNLAMPAWVPGWIQRTGSTADSSLESLNDQYGIRSRLRADEKLPWSLDRPLFVSYERLAHPSGNGGAVEAPCYDPIAALLRTGNWNESMWEPAASAVASGSVWVDFDVYAEGGAHRILELGYGMSHLAALLDKFGPGLDSDALPTVYLQTSLAGDFFLDIAKTRAIRWLFVTLAREYGLNLNCRILVRPGLRNKTVYDFNNNLLRSTLECASGIIGGADEAYNLPYDLWFKEPNSFSDRLSITQLLVLKHEAFLNDSQELSDRAYYVDYLTSQLAQKALNLLKKVQLEGGIIEAALRGEPQQEVAHAAGTQQELYDRGDAVLLGSNYQINKEERMSEMVDPGLQEALIQPLHAKAFAQAHPSELPRILPLRWAAGWEADRLKKELHPSNA